MDKKSIITAAIVILVLFAGFSIFSGQSDNDKKIADVSVSETGQVKGDFQLPEGVVLYYGDTCPFCHDVEEFIDENDVRSKFEFTEKEIYNNRENANELTQVGEYCQIQGGVGVPFLFAEGQCMMGYPEVVGYLSEKAGISAVE